MENLKLMMNMRRLPMRIVLPGFAIGIVLAALFYGTRALPTTEDLVNVDIAQPALTPEQVVEASARFAPTC